MGVRNLILPVISFLLLSCGGGKHVNIESSEEVPETKTEAETKYFEGRFYKIEKINQRDYSLQLKTEKDSVTAFLTVMPLSDTEIQLLKKSGNNIKLNYCNFFNPVKKITEKVVVSMVPVYDFGKK